MIWSLHIAVSMVLRYVPLTMLVRGPVAGGLPPARHMAATSTCTRISIHNLATSLQAGDIEVIKNNYIIVNIFRTHNITI